MHMIQNKKGVTLIELIVAITIMVTLSTMWFLAVSWWTSSARDAVRIDDVNNITTAIDLYHIDRSKYPEPTNPVDVTHSWATVWTQGGFWKDTIRQTGRIFWQIQDPWYDIDYTYSVTNSRTEYQLSYVLEDPLDNLISSVDVQIPNFVGSAYASGGFSPNEFNPIIWLDGEDIDGDGDTSDNPTSGSTISTWVNKSTAGSTNNPTVTNGNIQFTDNGFDWNFPWVYISNWDWLRLNNSAISEGDIFYVVQNNDPFNTTDTNGRALQSTTWNFLIWYWSSNRNALYINGSPSHYSSSPATGYSRTVPFIYWYHAENWNYSFRDTGSMISNWAANSISGREWWFNRAGARNQRADFVVSEILIYSSALSASEREKVEWYLAYKWWQERWLPNNHPYKDAPPTWWTPPPPPDTIPDAFSFNNITDAALSAEFISNTITISWINTSTPIAISGWGSYSINDGPYTSSDGNVNEGDTVKIRQTSSSSNSAPVNSIVTIGTWWSAISDTFTITTLDADITPDSFSFSSISDADIDTSYTSNSILVSWINTSVPISISWGDAKYRISTWPSYDTASSGSASASSTDALNTPDEAFDNNSTEWWGTNNVLPGWLKYDLWSWNADRVNKYTLYRNSSQPGNWWASDSPRDWRFEWSNNNSDWTVLDTQINQVIQWDTPKSEYTFENSNTYRYYRLYITDSNASDGSDWANITEVEFINDWLSAATSSSWTVSNWDSIEIIMTSSDTAGSTEVWTLTIWSVSEDYSISTISPDNIPDSFSFTDVEDANLNTLYTSNSITISGINTWADINISWAWEYRINGWSYTTGQSTVNAGDTVEVRQLSSTDDAIKTSSTLDIEGVEATYNVTTPAPPPNAIPDSFTFTDIDNANLSTQYFSNSITVSGINVWTDIDIFGWEYDINGDRNYISTSGIGTINNDDIISVRGTSSPLVWETVSVTLTIGGISRTFDITTILPDTVPDSFTLDDVSNATLDTLYSSNAITVSWINTTTSINVSDGAYSINGWAYTSAEGTVINGDTVRVNHTSSTESTTSTETTLTIWTVSDTYTTTTVLADTTIDAFSFNDKSDVPLSILEESEITISWVNTWVPISITGSGTYRINGWPYTSLEWQVIAWDVVSVRQVSSSEKSDSVNSTVTIAGESDIFTVTTIVEEPELSSVVTKDVSNVYVTWNYNGLFAHSVSEVNNNHYVFVAPSIIATDLSNPDFLDIINNKKFVYTWYDNHPSTYTSADSDLTSAWWFDQYRISWPVIFEWTRQELTAYSGIKQVDNGVRSTYRTTDLYRSSAQYLDNYGTWYIEDILWNIIGINPIKPYYCSDILDKEFTENIAELATITATENTRWWWVSGTWGIANGIKSTQWNLDYEYHSDTKNAFINFEWEENQPVWFIRIYNRTGSNGVYSSRLSGATISLYDDTNALLYAHTLWDTTNDYVVDLDLEWIGKLYDNVKKITIRSQWSDSYLNLREVEIYVWWTIKDGFYLVDSDGIWGQKPYEVYCDMTTDGWGWTKIWDNQVLNWDFSNWEHALDYPSDWANWNRENNIVLINNPSKKPYAMRQTTLGSNNSIIDYDIVFSDVLGFQLDSEIRLSAWVADVWDEWDNVDGGKWYIFKNRLTYTDGSYVENGEKVTLDTQVVDWKTWKLEMVRIPITKEVQWFKWEVGQWAEISSSRDFYFADLKAEIYYK